MSGRERRGLQPRRFSCFPKEMQAPPVEAVQRRAMPDAEDCRAG
jgi:hypothetical protein